MSHRDQLYEIMRAKGLLPSELADLLGLDTNTFNAYLTNAQPADWWKNYEHVIGEKLKSLQPIKIAPKDVNKTFSYSDLRVAVNPPKQKIIRKHGTGKSTYVNYIEITDPVDPKIKTNTITIVSQSYITPDKLRRIQDILGEPTPTIEDMLKID
jgi:hypothetical protein